MPTSLQSLNFNSSLAFGCLSTSDGFEDCGPLLCILPLLHLPSVFQGRLSLCRFCCLLALVGIPQKCLLECQRERCVVCIVGVLLAAFSHTSAGLICDGFIFSFTTFLWKEILRLYLCPVSSCGFGFCAFVLTCSRQEIICGLPSQLRLSSDFSNAVLLSTFSTQIVEYL